MSIGFEGEVDLSEFREDMRKLPVIFQSATVTGLNRAVKVVGSLINRQVSKRYNITSKRMRQSNKFDFATKSKLSANIITDEKVISLSSFKAKPKRKSRGPGRGVTVAVKKGRRVTVKGAWLALGRGNKQGSKGLGPTVGKQLDPFNATTKRGGLQIWTRGDPDQKQRYPIERKIGPSPAAMVRSAEVQRVLTKQVPEIARDRISNEILRKLQRALR